MPDKALRTGRHCVFMLHAHLIFITKYRGKVLSRAMLRDMEKIMRDVCAIQDVTLAEFNGETDHDPLDRKERPDLVALVLRRFRGRRAHRGVETLHRTTAGPSLIAYRRCAILPLPEGRGLSRFLVIRDKSHCVYGLSLAWRSRGDRWYWGGAIGFNQLCL